MTVRLLPRHSAQVSTPFAIRLPHLTALMLGLSGQALAAPHDSAHETLRTITVRTESADQALGMATEAYEDARRWDGLDMPAPLLDRCPPSEVLAGSWQAAWWYVDSRAGLREGTLAPWNRSGDEERGIAGVELGATGGIHWGVLEAHVGADVLGAVGPLGAAVRLDTLRIGTRLPGFHAGFSLRDRWVGPGRLGSLMFTDNAAPLPAVEVGGTWTFPGRAQVLGRFGTEVAVGWIPEASRRGVERPGWLLLDLRWQPLPWIEVGLTRNAMFGGKGRPVDVGQLILPTRPHVEGDPDRLLPDTDAPPSTSASPCPLPAGGRLSTTWSSPCSTAERTSSPDAPDRFPSRRWLGSQTCMASRPRPPASSWAPSTR